MPKCAIITQLAQNSLIFYKKIKLKCLQKTKSKLSFQVFQLAKQYYVQIQLLPLMTQIKYDSNTLDSIIESVEARIACLMEQQTKEKVQHQILINNIKMLQDNKRKPSLKNRLDEQHRLNMKYFDQKIVNHEQTFFKFKKLYDSITSNRNSSSYASLAKSSLNNLKLSNGFLKGKAFNLQESDMSSKSGANCNEEQWPKLNQSINVVSQIQCQICGQTFKPYSYYQHLQACKHRNLPEQMCTSMLVE